MSLMYFKMVTPEEVAEHLKVTRRTVYRWIESGELAACKAGRSWRIRELDLEAFLQWKTPVWTVAVRVHERQAGPDLDAEIARELLGRNIVSTREGLREQLPSGELRPIPPYSSDGSAGQQLRDELRNTRGWELVTSPPGSHPCENEWFAGWSHGGRQLAGAGGPTQNLAVCRAALKQHYISNTDISANMPAVSTPSEILVREDRDQR